VDDANFADLPVRGGPSRFAGCRKIGVGMPVSDQLQQLAGWSWSAVNRLAAYALLNFLDDPAMLAFAFC
jgi:hypothetical protein